MDGSLLDQRDGNVSDLGFRDRSVVFARIVWIHAFKSDVCRKCLVASMVDHSCIEILPAAFTERLSLFVSQLLVQAAEQSLVVDTHRFKEAHLKLLPVSAELGRQTVSLRLELFL